jgi:uncharacterized membrane protein YdjX (TVP38/TMEM64 family)
VRLAVGLAGLAVLLLLPFLLFGEHLEVLLSGSRLAALFAAAEGWGWLIGLGLLGADLVLPIPATGVMAALGMAYGPLLGGALSALGSFLAGSFGYGACRLLSGAQVERLLGPDDLRRARRLAADLGGWLVAGSRALPLLPELVACAAGLVRMPPGRFFPALACGAIPTGLVFAGLGALGSDRPVLTVAAATLLPLAIWPIVRLGSRHEALED